MGSGWNNDQIALLVLNAQATGYSGLFVYSPSPGPGNLIGSWAAAAGIDPYGNSYPAGLSVDLGVLEGVAIAATTMTLDPGPFLLYGNINQTVTVFTTTGTFTPPGNGTVNVGFYGAGAAGTAHAGGGGGEFANDTDTVTGSTPYTITLDSTSTRATFNTKTITAHSATSATGASGSTNAVHYNGGNGSTTGFAGGGGGAGGGGPGGNGSAGLGGSGGPAGGLYPAGGEGGIVAAGTAPGGGGGGAGSFAGAAGLAVIVYTETGGSLSLVAAIAQGPGTDPNTGDTYDGGVETFNPAFGSGVQMVGGILNLKTANGTPQFQGAAGSAEIIAGAGGLHAGLSGYINFSPAADFTNFTVTAASFTQCSKNWSIPANDPQVGTVYRLTVEGSGTQGSTAQTLTFALGVSAGNEASAGLLNTFAAASTNFTFKVVFEVTFITTGSSGTADISTQVQGKNGVATGFTTAVAFDTTSAVTLKAQAEWGSTTGAPTFTSYHSVLERIGP